MKRFNGIAVVAALSLITLSSCSGGSESASSSSSTASSVAATASATPVELNVFAAASLNKAFPEIADTVLKESDPNIKVTFNFQGSPTLVDQMKEGAPADVFASADQKNMTKASDAKLVDAPKPFASNVLTLIVPKGNPGKITGLDSSLDGKKLVVCAQGVPCGNATKQLAEKLGVTLNPVSEEQKVTDVRAKVESGEADAGLVYATDAKAAGDKVETIEVARANEVVNSYPIALTVSTQNKEAAQKFIDAVLSDKGQAVLKKYGFSAPTAADKG
ncbi:molybdate ABC transporter substrate-binding protein [uncultured Actinomyces sp.]|uniref:molybdate ABC transporter substrate-binding protein n=1 Tax=uncultured Actinomyces sp. TaxID=249061 RepID=UPI002623F38A|nr:molybdate ABC transporter substrate-binding protein [uncultured Actinomyces sp.]